MTRANLVNGKWLPGYPVDVEHNHSALKNIEVLAYHNKYRKLNEEDQQKMFKILANTDASNTFIAASLTPLGSNLVLRVDIKNQKARLQQALNERDNNDKLRPLMQLLESNDYITSYEVDSENRLTHLFFAHSSAVELNFQIALAWSSDEETESYEWFLQKLKEKVSHFAIDLIKGQIAKHHDEIREKIPKRPCTNYYQKIYRWPCRHMTDPENLDAVTSMYLIGKRWLLDEEIEHSADEEVPTTASQVISSSNMTINYA
ncbi:hypothetical protein MUCCIDRAFT_159740 [Mucor lusitanicus CBS 277.49]|uniref:MULE transposase domain-containing protein n=1 Tax=Mucor lusitanicus CBS 277.49 TaxID=747725 RepID=A0A168NBD5_MUCCL|nr:hypothetical protein MUCCIDRAFT_159740 [Mucor lusitanicus CBS 277.49]